MKTVVARTPTSTVPEWAVLERRLIALLNESVDILLDNYLTPEGEIFWPESVRDFQTYAYGAVDNAFESFSSWPLFYILGGDRRFLTLAQRQYDALVQQFSRCRKTKLGIDEGRAMALGRNTLLVDEWFPDLDWMHKGEAAMFLYYLNLANPKNDTNRGRTLKIAEYLVGENPAGFEPNYDSTHRVFRSSYFGTNGPAYEKFRHPIARQNWMTSYGLAFHDVRGVATLLDLDAPDNARRYGEAYGQRMAHADTVTNLLSTSLALNAYLYTGDERYREWILDYTDGWRARCADNEGIMPDNAGPHGIVGETMDGRWYGGHYGWVFPHGFQFIADAMIVAGENERLLTGKRGRLDWVRDQFTTLSAYAVTREDGVVLLPQKHTDSDAVLEYGGGSGEPMTRPDRVTNQAGYTRKQQVDGWYEFRPPDAAHLAHLYADSFSLGDMSLARQLSRQTAWEQVTPSAVKGKYKGGQDSAYLHYLAGGYPDYPMDALRHSMSQVHDQTDALRAELDEAPGRIGYAPDSDQEWADLRTITCELREKYGLRWTEATVHSYYQTFLLYRNPVTTEALVHLTMGGVMPTYNGGVPSVAVRHFDAEKKRPGLPADVAALVTRLEWDRIELSVCNLHPNQSRRLIIQAGAYGEHRFATLRLEGESHTINGKWFELRIEPGCRADMAIGLERYRNTPSLEEPV
ncbi:MAG: hypothetical protein HN742_41125 [Lentisphaerae bacterium]|jgi:hypothetical protein|nr:hypothetical protein [Lentisphaerota bacterium]MBT4818422.1 hypothetical protein [Lentisphaerota bacterium]MBT5608356.1 hypothetical protein [Lentisphaerota bacterium]MBT7060973.1 hypothetical protein [Lentisphaerota bacterium]MBT7848340.1 hypothetical protein [Lentisphaerota bacterium]